MGWNRKYALRSYVRSALWIIPLGAYLTAMIALRVLGRLDEFLGWTWYWKLELGAAQNALVTIIGATLFVVGLNHWLLKFDCRRHRVNGACELDQGTIAS